MTSQKKDNFCEKEMFSDKILKLLTIERLQKPGRLSGWGVVKVTTPLLARERLWMPSGVSSSFEKMLEIAFTGFGGQVYLKKTMVGNLDGSGAGALRAPLLLLLPV